MGRAKGKERKEHKRPFVAKLKVSEDIVGDNFTYINVTVTLETKVGEMKRRIAAAEPTLRADRLEIAVGPKIFLDDDEKTLADLELSKDSIFVLFTLEQLTVQTLERSFTLLVTTNGTTQYIKCTIENRHPDLPAAKMVLVHNGAVLRNDEKLVERGVTEGSAARQPTVTTCKPALNHIAPRTPRATGMDRKPCERSKATSWHEYRMSKPATQLATAHDKSAGVTA